MLYQIIAASLFALAYNAASSSATTDLHKVNRWNLPAAGSPQQLQKRNPQRRRQGNPQRQQPGAYNAPPASSNRGRTGSLDFVAQKNTIRNLQCIRDNNQGPACNDGGAYPDPGAVRVRGVPTTACGTPALEEEIIGIHKEIFGQQTGGFSPLISAVDVSRSLIIYRDKCTAKS